MHSLVTTLAEPHDPALAGPRISLSHTATAAAVLWCGHVRNSRDNQIPYEGVAVLEPAAFFANLPGRLFVCWTAGRAVRESPGHSRSDRLFFTVVFLVIEAHVRRNTLEEHGSELRVLIVVQSRSKC